MTLAERAELYRRAFPKFQPLSVVDTAGGKQRLEGLWIMGNDYRVKSGYYGGYPAGYLPRVMSMFPDSKSCLHLFSGKVGQTDDRFTTFDINPDNKPGIIGDAENLSGVLMSIFQKPILFDLILADPPYSNTDAERYGTCMVKRNIVVRECLKVLTPGGFLIWLDQVFPLHRKAESPLVGSIYVRDEFPGLDHAGEIGIIKSTNHRVRAAFIFQKT